ncbi:MAG: CDP-archaeol synthase [Verrucomicrobiota bacterium]|nr:CDP-archaeol synthase [Verrucomicrobiota bacterium]
MLHSILIALWIVIPIMAAGLMHVAIIKLRFFQMLAAVPLDFGATIAGRSLFGENKTFRGAFVMIAAAIICVSVHVAVSSRWTWTRDLMPEVEQEHPMIWGGLAGVGYIVGELPNSFLKRRWRIGPGASASGPWRVLQWFVDQLDSMIGVVLFLLPVWRPSIAVLVSLAGWTLVAHPAVAFVMLRLGLKKRVG